MTLTGHFSGQSGNAPDPVFQLYTATEVPCYVYPCSKEVLTMNKIWRVMQEMKEAFKQVELSYVIEELPGEGAAALVSIPMKSPRF